MKIVHTNKAADTAASASSEALSHSATEEMALNLIVTELWALVHFVAGLFVLFQIYDESKIAELLPGWWHWLEGNLSEKTLKTLEEYKSTVEVSLRESGLLPILPIGLLNVLPFRRDEKDVREIDILEGETGRPPEPGNPVSLDSG